jgi:hypothetical protein
MDFNDKKKILLRIKIWCREIMFDETAATVVEYSLFIAILVVLIFGLVYLINWKPDIVEKAPWAALLTAIIAGIAWSVKQTISALHQRAQLLIIEMLSDGKPRNRQEISILLKREAIIFKIIPVYVDALADLVLTGKIVIENGNYKVPN